MEYRCENDEYCPPTYRPTNVPPSRARELCGIVRSRTATARYYIYNVVFAERYMDDVKQAFPSFFPPSLFLSFSACPPIYFFLARFLRTSRYSSGVSWRSGVSSLINWWASRNRFSGAKQPTEATSFYAQSTRAAGVPTCRRLV